MAPIRGKNGPPGIPTTVAPTSLLISPSAYVPPATSAPIPPPPLPSTSTALPSIISPPAKRSIRSRATTEEEKQQRLEERKMANRTAAKLSRERQKQTMEEAQRENDRLKRENAQLHARLARLEERMAQLESETHNQAGPRENETSSSTHQPARPMSPTTTTTTTEQQCPMSLVAPTSSMTPRYSSLTLMQMRMVVYVLRILMHSFALSVRFRMPFTQFPMTLQSSRPSRSVIHKTFRRSSRWMNVFRGYATPNLRDLRGATRSSVTLRGRVKSCMTQIRTRQVGKDWLRMVRRDGHRRGKTECIRLIIKKKIGKTYK
jgi:hypothetical protein